MNLAFDLDSTLVDLETPIKGLFKKHGFKYKSAKDWEMSNYPSKIRKIIIDNFSDPKFMCSLKPFLGVRKLIKKLRKSHNIIIVTARSVEKETLEYVKKLFNVECIVVKPNQNKIDILVERKVRFYFDDKPTELLNIKEKGIVPVMISNKGTKYNHYLRKKVNHIERITDFSFKWFITK